MLWYSAQDETFERYLIDATASKQGWEDLRIWAKDADLTVSQKLAVYELLVDPPVFKGRPSQSYKHSKLRMIANVLQRDFGMQRSHNKLSDTKSIARLLADLPDTPDADSIDKIIAPRKTQGY